MKTIKNQFVPMACCSVCGMLQRLTPKGKIAKHADQHTYKVCNGSLMKPAKRY